MSYVSHLQGIGSGAVYPPDSVMNLCPQDGRPVQMVFDLERLAADQPAAAWYQPTRQNMWRFGALLALDPDDPVDRQHVVCLGEGHTPLTDLAQDPIARHLGIALQLKQEGWPEPGFGSNPTQSFKDRGMAMAVSMARKLGLRRLVVPTQGNAGDSLVEYALAAGVEVAVVMPEDTPMPILGRVAALAHRHPAVHLELVNGTIREAGLRVREHWLGRGFFNVATFQEPGWRIEGKKTLGLEIAEPNAGGNWSLPDAIIYPTGGGTGMLGMWKAFDELECLGLVDSRRPRMIAVQSEATRPLVDAFAEGAEDTVSGSAGDTIAVGLNVPGGVGHFRVLQILRESSGGAVAVSDQAIGETLRRYWQERHWWLAPEGAATLAVLPALAEQGLIRQGERVVAVNTGSLEKYLPDLRHWLL